MRRKVSTLRLIKERNSKKKLLKRREILKLCKKLLVWQKTKRERKMNFCTDLEAKKNDIKKHHRYQKENFFSPKYFFRLSNILKRKRKAKVLNMKSRISKERLKLLY
jgi:hypothetical protein